MTRATSQRRRPVRAEILEARTLLTLTVTIADDSISENGGMTTATVSRDTDTTSALFVSLSSDNTAEATVPATVTIDAGQTTSAPFNITAVDESDFDGTQTVTVTASATGQTPGSDTLEVTDDDPLPSVLAELTMSLRELDAAPGLRPGEAFEIDVGFRDVVNDQALFSGYADIVFDNAIFRVDAIVHHASYPAGRSGTIDNPAGVVDEVGGTDGLAPPPELTVFTLQVTALTSGTASFTSDSGESVVSEIVSFDDRLPSDLRATTDFGTLSVTVLPPAALSVTIAANSVSEGDGTAATTATVSRNTDTADALTINLASSNTNEATVPTSVTIDAGQTTSAPFNIDAVDDLILDGLQTVTITASAADHLDGTDSLDVTDNEVLLDYGDAPDEYGTLLESDGARHFPMGPQLGGTRDAELNAQSPLNGSGDDSNNSGSAVDEDGLVVPIFTEGIAGTLNIDVRNPDSSEASYAVWIDVNGIAGFQDELVSAGGDRIVAAIAAGSFNGIVPLSVTLPIGAWANTGGTTYARARIRSGTDPENMSATGLMMDGEVEDYVVTIIPAPALTVNLVAETIGEADGTAATTATVSRNSDTANALTVMLSSSNTNEATVPASVTIAAGQTTSAPFNIDAIDDGLLDGAQSVTITATASDHIEGSDTLSVLDDEMPTTLDIDLDGTVNAATDGILALRYLFGLRGAPLIAGALGTGSTSTATEVAAALDASPTMLDVDGNGTPDAATDGILLIRYLFGFRNAGLVDGAVGSGATRATGADVAAFLNGFQPSAGPLETSEAVTGFAFVVDDEESDLFAVQYAPTVDTAPQQSNDEPYISDVAFEGSIDWLSIV